MWRLSELVYDNKPALGNFTGQIASKVNVLFETGSHVCLLPVNTTNLLQPLDVSVNKQAKDFLKRKLEAWYIH